MRGKQIVLCLALIMGVVLLCYGLYIGVMIGADWYGKDAHFEWHMNNYFVIEGQYAYSIFGLAPMVVGGFATGLAVAIFFSFHKNRKHVLVLMMAFFIGIVMSGLSFNTLNFMLGSFYWTNMTYPPPVQVFLIGLVDVWNFYFFLFVVPLWTSGFLMGSAIAYFNFIYRPLSVAEAYIAKKNLGVTVHQGKAYLAESQVFWRSRSGIRKGFDSTN